VSAPGLAVPVDVVELVVRALRPLLAAHPVGAETKVSTTVGTGPDGGPPSLPWLLVAEDAHTWTWPAVQRSVIRLTCWHTSEHAAKAATALALGLLCARPAPALLLASEPVAAPVAAADPYTRARLATAACAVYVRTPARP
jgi:hypothetical protein